MRKVMHPTAQISVAKISSGVDDFPFLFELNSSGAMNRGVPLTVDANPASPSMRLLIPKSPIFTHQGSGGVCFTSMF
jgi:hypothetical protein